MENNNNKLEQYEDAALALVMDEHALESGRQLLSQFEQAKAKGDLSVFPAQQDEKNRALIRKTFRKQRLQNCLKKLSRVGSKAAMWFFLLTTVTLAGIHVAQANDQIHIDRHMKNRCSVSEMSDRYVIHIRFLPSSEDQDHAAISKIMGGLTDLGYSRVSEYTEDLGGLVKPGLYSRYQNSQGQIVRLDSCAPISGQVIVYKDDCTAQEVLYVDYDMILVERKDAMEVYWLDDAEGLRYCLYAEGLTDRQFWDLVYDLAKK